MCCNVQWAIKDFALNILSLEGERNFALGLRTTVRALSSWGMLFRRPGLTAAELKIQKLMIYSTDQPSWVALELLLGYLLSLKDALGRPPIAGSRC